MKTETEIKTRLAEIASILSNKNAALSGDQRDKLLYEENALTWVVE